MRPLCEVEFLWSPRGSGETARTAHSLDEVLAIIDEITASESEPPDGKNPTAWATVVLRNAKGDRLHVGKSDVGWLLILLEVSKRARILRGNVAPGPRVVFLIPDWTDFAREDLVEPQLGEALIEAWVKGQDILKILADEKGGVV